MLLQHPSSIIMDGLIMLLQHSSSIIMDGLIMLIHCLTQLQLVSSCYFNILSGVMAVIFNILLL